MNGLGAALRIVIGLVSGSGVQPPPPAAVHPVVDDYFGTRVVDNYRYMERLEDPAVQAWMKTQAEYTRAMLDRLPDRAAVLERMTDLANSTPVWVFGLRIVGGRYYTMGIPAGGQLAKLFVRDGIHGQERLLIDPGKNSDPTAPHVTLDAYAPSPDNRYVAYVLTSGGTEHGEIHVLDVAAGRDLPDRIDRIHGANLQWRDGTSFYYLREQKLEPGAPAAEKYNRRAYLHVLGRLADADSVVLGAGVSETLPLTPDENAGILTTPGSHYALAEVNRGTDARSRLYVAPVATVKDGKATWRAVAASYDDQVGGGSPLESGVALHGDTLYYLSYKNAPRGQILLLDLARADSKPQVIVPPGELPISEVYAGRDALYWRVNDAGVGAIHRLRFARAASPVPLRLPYPATIGGLATDAASDAAVLAASSWLRSPAYLGVDARTGAVADSGLRPSGPDDNPGDLVAEEVKVTSWDGTDVPLSIIHRKGLVLDGSHPTELNGYGAYGISGSPNYDPIVHAKYERGVVVAIAHPRGGGEYGEPWHLAGFQETKPNTWKDFIACAEYLIARRYTSPEKLVGRGASAGGILIGRAIEERPDLFAAAIAEVPVADALRFETSANGARNVPEFGSVKTERGFRALYAMSPYANVQDGVKYPAVLVTTGINDPRVEPWIAAKFAARLQAATASGKPVMLRVDYDSGHNFSTATMKQVLEGFADIFSFELWQTGDPAFQPKGDTTPASSSVRSGAGGGLGYAPREHARNRRQ